MKRLVLAIAALGIATNAWGQGGSTGSQSSPTNVIVKPPLGIGPVPTLPNSPPPNNGGGGGWIPPGGGWWPRPRPPWVINYNPPIIVGVGPWGLNAWSPGLYVGSGLYGGPLVAPTYVPVPTPFPVAVPTPVEAPEINVNKKNENLRPVGANRDILKERDQIQRGDRLFKAGKPGPASERYKQAIKANPDSFQARLRLSEVSFSKGDYADAASWIHEAIAADPVGLEKHANVEAMFAEPDDFKDAIDRLETHLQAKPEDRDGWMVLGVQHLLTGHPDRASDAFLRLDPDRADPTLRALMLAAATKLKF